MDSAKLGKTLSHEHFFVDLSVYVLKPKNRAEEILLNEPVSLRNLFTIQNNCYSNLDNLILDDFDVAMREVDLFKKAGGNTICDVTPEGLPGTDINKVTEIARKAKINIIAGCAHYINEAQPEHIKNMTLDKLTQYYIDEITNGIQDTGIRPGIIGEIGTGYVLHPNEVKVLRAGACAHHETGLSMTVHCQPYVRRGHEVLDILIKEEGVSSERIILDHLDCSLAHTDIDFQQSVDYISSLASRGCYIEFDLCGLSTHWVTQLPSIPGGELHYWWPSDRERAKALAILCQRGFSNQILLSQDIAVKYYCREWGGWGYSHVLSNFQVYLSDAGIDPHIASRFNVDNPRRILEIRK
jgi:phosphotriesterase-related protein